MISSNDSYYAFIKEYFDLTDNETRRCLLSINEADRNQVVASIANKLYSIIVKKVDDIDFGQIPNSKGDITKIPNYNEIVEAIDTVRQLLVVEHQKTDSIDVVTTAIENLKRSRELWQKAFALECDMAVMYYNTIALGVVAATSIYISTAVELVKDAKNEQVELILARVINAKSKDNLLMSNLVKFNKMYAKGEIDKTFRGLLSAQRTAHESVLPVEIHELGLEAIPVVLAGGGIAIMVVTSIIPCIHQMVTMFYNLRTTISDYLALEAAIVMLNAEKVNYDRSKTPEQRKKIVKKQLEWAARFKKWSDAIAVKTNKAQIISEKEIDEETSEKNKIGDISNSAPDSSIF